MELGHWLISKEIPRNIAASKGMMLSTQIYKDTYTSETHRNCLHRHLKRMFFIISNDWLLENHEQLEIIQKIY